MNLGMKLLSSALALGSIIVSAPSNAQEYQTVLIGGGLDVCNSLEPQNCKSKLKTTESSHTENQFKVSSKQFQKLKKLYAENANLHDDKMTKVVAKLAALNVSEQVFNERELKAFFRENDIDYRRNMSEQQLLFVADVLQQPIVLKRFLQRDGVKKVKVNIANSRKEFVGRSLREFLSIAKGDELVFVTAANSDAFEDVYLLKQAFEQMDVDATWLPIDAAVAEVWRSTNVRNKESLEKSCNSLEAVRRDKFSRYYRGNIYPELNEQLIKICNKPEQLSELIDEADAIYFHDGSPEILIKSMMQDAQTPLPFFKRMKSRHSRNSLVFGFNGGAVNAVAGNERGNAIIFGGDSHLALQTGDEYLKQNVGLHGLGLFEHMVFDHAVSNYSRQIRMMASMLLQRVPIGLGVDERTVVFINKTKDGAVVEVKGEAGAMVLSSTKAELVRRQPMLLRDINMSYMTQEDRLEISNNKLTFDFANWKYSSNSSRQPVVNAGDALRANNFQKTMYMLCSTAADKATLKHIELGKGHQIEVEKLSNSVSVAGSRNVGGESFGYCSFRDYNVTAIPIRYK